MRLSLFMHLFMYGHSTTTLSSLIMVGLNNLVFDLHISVTFTAYKKIEPIYACRKPYYQ